MRITPVSNYNYTNQKVQKNNNQPSFGMIIPKENLGEFIEKVSLKGPKTLEAFISALGNHAKELGLITHNNQQIVAEIVPNNDAFFVRAMCRAKLGLSDTVQSALGNTSDHGRELAYRLISALEQAAHNANPERNTCDGIIASNLADAIAKHDPTVKP